MKALRNIGVSVCVALAAIGVGSPANAATDTDTFTVSITIQAECEIASVDDLTFGTHGVLSADVSAAADLNIQCTDTTAYRILLNEGETTGATIATRLMENAGQTAFVEYSLYQDNLHADLWGETIGVDTVDAVGDGTVETYTIYGLVPTQTTPAPTTYTDQITVTIDF